VLLGRMYANEGWVWTPGQTTVATLLPDIYPTRVNAVSGAIAGQQPRGRPRRLVRRRRAGRRTDQAQLAVVRHAAGRPVLARRPPGAGRPVGQPRGGMAALHRPRRSDRRPRSLRRRGLRVGRRLGGRPYVPRQRRRRAHARGDRPVHDGRLVRARPATSPLCRTLRQRSRCSSSVRRTGCRGDRARRAQVAHRGQGAQHRGRNKRTDARAQ
jgi:hypothetical protein